MGAAPQEPMTSPPGMSLEGMMQPQSGLPQAGDNIDGPSSQGIAMPSLPTPPAPFENLATNPADNIPQ
jgi:hypothetical protein